jgi:hypothetical protein
MLELHLQNWPDRFDPGLLNVEIPQVSHTRSDDNFIKTAGDTLSYSTTLNTTFGTQPIAADFVHGSTPVDREVCNKDSTPQAAQRYPQPQHHKESPNVYEEAPRPKKHRRHSEEAVQCDHGRKVARTSISLSAKRILMQAFRTDPYLNHKVSETLATRTGLGPKTIRTWYANERRRNKILSSK